MPNRAAALSAAFGWQVGTVLSMPYQKIAQNLIESHCTLECFDVDFFDEQTSNAVAQELERLGCTVERDPHKSHLHVICPESWKEGSAGA